MNYSTGQRIHLNSATGPISRIVVKDLGNVVLVTRQEEFERAQAAAEEPISVGFKKRDIIEVGA